MIPFSIPAQSLPVRQQSVAVFLGLGTFCLIIFLVRQRKLREEFAWLWLLTGLGILLLSIWYRFLLFITMLIGAVLPTSALFFCGLLFVMGICLHFSIKLSALTNQVKNLTQEFSILRADVQKLTEEKTAPPTTGKPAP